MFQLNLFNAKLAACEVSKAEIALVIGCNESTLYRKLSGKSDFTRNEIQMIRQKLNLSAEEIESIFLYKTCIYASFEGGQNYEYSDINDVSDLYLQWIKNKKPRMPNGILPFRQNIRGYSIDICDYIGRSRVFKFINIKV